MYQSQFIEMFDFHELNINAPSMDFDSMCFDDTSSATKIPAGDYLQEGKYAIYDQSQEKDIAGFSNKEQGLCRNYPAVLFGDHSRVVKYINEPFFIGADGVKIIRPKEDNLIPEFLYYDLKYHTIPNTGYNRHFKYIKMISLTKSSLEEQRRFLSIAQQADKSKFSGLKSQFIEMFKDAPIVKLGEHINTQSGGTPNTKKTEYYEGGDIPWLSSGEVNQGYINGTEKYITKAGLDNSSAKWSPEHSIVIAMYGATAGKVGYLNIPVTTNQAVCTLLPSSSFVPKFLYYAVSNKSSWMVSQCQGAAQPNISQGIIRKMEIPMPEKSLQREFVLIVEQADKSKFELKKSIEAIDKVIKSLINNI